jgi:hypothetical protein
MKTIHLGFEVKTGLPVELPLHHLVACGLTRASGKTTTLEALISRSGHRAIVFLTKRGEGGFESGNTVRPYFKPRIDWLYVASLLEATMQEKMNFKRPWIIRVSEGAKSLEQVHHNTKVAMEKARGLSLDMYTTLDAYFDMVLPEIRRMNLSDSLKLSDGLNVMRLEHMRPEVQALVISSVIDEVYKNYRDTITVIPECWKFIPRGRGSPVKPTVNNLIRQGAVLGNFCFFDSQDIAGIDAGILKSVDIWLLGRQRELNEIKRMVDYMPVRPKPRPDQIATLGVGQFVACFGHEVKTVYVQPAWMSWGDAQSVATGMLPLETASEKAPKVRARLEDFDRRDSEETQPTVSSPSEPTSSLGDTDRSMEVEDMGRIQELEDELRMVKANLDETTLLLRRAEENNRTFIASARERGKSGPINPFPIPREPAREDCQTAEPATLTGQLDQIVLAVIQRLKSKPELLSVSWKSPRIEVNHEPVTVKTDGSTFRGRVARLIHAGWFDSERSCKEVADHLSSTGTRVIAGNIPRDLKWFVESEFLELHDKQYVSANGAKKRVQVSA